MAGTDDKSLVDLEEETAPDQNAPKFGISENPIRKERANTRTNTRTQKSDKPKTPPPAYKAGVIQNGVENMYTGISMFWSMVDPVCGTAFMQCAPAAAEAWEELAKTNPQVRAMLMRVFSGSAMGKVIVAHAPLLLAMFSHHGMGRIYREHSENSAGPTVPPTPEAMGFQSSLFDHETHPGEPLYRESPVPNNGQGFTYQMPENPALKVG